MPCPYKSKWPAPCRRFFYRVAAVAWRHEGARQHRALLHPPNRQQTIEGTVMFTRKHILQAIVSVASELGHPPSRVEFTSRSGISAFFVLQSFRSWSDAVRAAGLQPYTLNAKVKDRALLEDWGNVVRKNRGVLPRHIYRRRAKYNPCTLANRFGGWTSVPQAFRKFAKGKPEWADVVALLAAKNKRPLPAWIDPQRWPPALQHLSSKSQRAAFKDRLICGNPLPLPDFRHEPVNEQGVVLLFGMLAKDLGYLIEAVQKGFPDCEAKREVAPGRWQRVRIEFEYESKNFHGHGHPINGCDVIVCWRHNWEACPKHIEIVELSKVIQSFGA